MGRQSSNQLSQRRSGFTLIELLVTISIIGLLAAMVLARVEKARSQARDARRISDVEQLRNALALYRSNRSAYPTSGNCGSSRPSSSWCNSTQGAINNHWLRNGNTDLSEFLKRDPVDPKNTYTSSTWDYNNAYFYYSTNDAAPNQWYMIVFRLENYPNDLERRDGALRPATGTTYDYGGNGPNGIITLGKKI